MCDMSRKGPHQRAGNSAPELTRSSAIAEEPRDAPCQIKPCWMLHIGCRTSKEEYETSYPYHWRQPRRGCRGHIPQYFGWEGRQREYPLQYYYVLSDRADQYWMPRPFPPNHRMGWGVGRAVPLPHPTPFGGSSPQPWTRVDATDPYCGGSRHSSTFGRYWRVWSRVWATFIGFSLSLIAFFRSAISFSCIEMSLHTCRHNTQPLSHSINQSISQKKFSVS